MIARVSIRSSHVWSDRCLDSCPTETGDAGNDGTHLYADDPDALGRVYVGPYLHLSPAFSMVAADAASGAVCGYALATTDTTAFFERFAEEWAPPLRALFADPPLDARAAWTPAQHMHRVCHHPRELHCRVPPAVDQRRYPAHLHIDLVPRAQGRGLGRMLISALLGELQRAGVVGVHLGMHPMNARAKVHNRRGFGQQKARRRPKLTL